MIQTSYVPLEHPYQIIEYQGVLGIQIGTLIVTVDKSVSDGEYSIETHSHPVVSYVNNRIHPRQKKPSTISLPRPYEGVVWDKVELHQVQSLIREEEQMGWREFMDYCCRLRLFRLYNSHLDIDIAIFDAYGQLSDWGVVITDPKKSRNGETILMVEVDKTIEVNGIPYLITRGDLGLVVGIVDDNLAVRHAIKQVRKYLEFMDHFGITVDGVCFWTQNLFLQDITEKLKKCEDVLVLGDYEDIYARDYEEEDGNMLMAAESDE